MQNQKTEDKLVDSWKSDEERTLLDIATQGKYKTSKDLPPLTQISKEKIHDVLSTAGMTPGIGNVADAIDALLYTTEGEFGQAGMSAVNMIPIAGQLVNARKMLKKARESGEKMVTFYRGSNKWHRKEMVKDGNFIGKGDFVDSSIKESLWVTENKSTAEKFAKGNDGVLLEFEIPESYLNERFTTLGRTNNKITGIFSKGLPKGFLKKVHKK